ncbi:DnaA/Hda family protein [Bacillus sp. FJAT-50079]|uniref:DnaA ATPase domain-containing protein n=1 Tax=Bacillus sp. FJAT-50079 TaxID=2833577 RepID=UPI001BC8E04E|nr:DnaA/Hda family protein [Bacillus sp. FJAT-50079]MBS4209373.1 ATP-binding protein [Bacillus sp. FJAT-50079]
MEQENKQWSTILDLLKNRISKPSFETWFKQTKLKVKENEWLIIAPNEFARDWIESSYFSEIKNAIYQVTSESPHVKIIVEKQAEDHRYKVKNIMQLIESLTVNEREKLLALLNKTYSPRMNNLNPEYTFSNYISHYDNRLAYTAAKSISEAQGQADNPLYIYGPTTSGKTHLLHAIGNSILEQSPTLKVIIINAEQYIHEFIESIKNNTMDDFRLKYTQADLLLLDDIEILLGREQTQEELLHLFNVLFEKSKQIVFTSDRHPSEMSAMNERLLARLEWGAVIEIAPQRQKEKEIAHKKNDERLKNLEIELALMKERYSQLEVKLLSIVEKLLEDK